MIIIFLNIIYLLELITLALEGIVKEKYGLEAAVPILKPLYSFRITTESDFTYAISVMRDGKK